MDTLPGGKIFAFIKFGYLRLFSGEGGIRTREPLWVTRFPSVRAKPDYATSPISAGELYQMFFRRQCLITCVFGTAESAAESGGIGFVLEAAEGSDVIHAGIVRAAP